VELAAPLAFYLPVLRHHVDERRANIVGLLDRAFAVASHRGASAAKSGSGPSRSMREMRLGLVGAAARVFIYDLFGKPPQADRARSATSLTRAMMDRVI